MSTLRQAWLIARRDVALIIWRAEGIVWTFIMPIVFFYFLATATAPLRSPEDGEGPADPLALLAPDNGGILVDELVGRLEQQRFRVERRPIDASSQDQARRLVVEAEPPAGDSLTSWALAGNTITLRYESDAPEPAATLERFRVARATYGVLADAFVIASRGAAIERDAFTELAASPRALSLDVRPAGRRAVPPTGVGQAVPGTMVLLIMLVALTGGSIHLVLERNQGLLSRLATTPISRPAIVLGKLAGRVGVAAVQIAFAMLSAVVLFRFDWGPSLPMVAAVLLGWALFNAAFSVLVGSLARTTGQAMGIGILTTVVLASLGGAWWPIEIAPVWMQRLAAFVPTGWAMDAMHKLVSFGYEPMAALPQLLGLVAAAGLLCWVSARAFRYA